MVDVLKFLLRHLELLYLSNFRRFLNYGDPASCADVLYAHETNPMVHSRRDEFAIFGAESSIGYKRFVAFEFAVSIGSEVVNDDVVFVGHQDEVILTVTVKITQISEWNLQFYYTLQHEMRMIEHQNLLF